MSLIRGPFTLKWGDNVIQDVEEIDIEHEVDSEEYETIQGKTLTVDGAFRVAATLTLLSTDIASLAAIMPQYFVPNNQNMSTGEKVMNANGAIDFKAAACNASIVINDLDIISCANPAQVTRIVNCRTRIEDIDIDNKVQKIMVRFIGEGLGTEATLQIFRQGGMAIVS